MQATHPFLPFRHERKSKTSADSPPPLPIRVYKAAPLVTSNSRRFSAAGRAGRQCRASSRPRSSGSAPGLAPACAFGPGPAPPPPASPPPRPFHLSRSFRCGPCPEVRTQETHQRTTTVCRWGEGELGGKYAVHQGCAGAYHTCRRPRYDCQPSWGTKKGTVCVRRNKY